MSFGNGDSIDYGGTNNGGALSINGSAYTLIYNMGALQGLNSGDLSANYALATSLDAATDATMPASWTPLGVDAGGSGLNSGRGFAGVFEGLGHTISNLSVDRSVDHGVGLFDLSYAGLFGLSNGTIRDIGLVGGRISRSIMPARWSVTAVALWRMLTPPPMYRVFRMLAG